MEGHVEVMKKYVGKHVHCHTVFGTYDGVVYKVLRKGIILVQHVQLAGTEGASNDFATGDFHPNVDDTRLETVQFFGPGIFLPYAGIYGIRPIVPFFI